jgi:hypothetical protein
MDNREIYHFMHNWILISNGVCRERDRVCVMKYYFTHKKMTTYNILYWSFYLAPCFCLKIFHHVSPYIKDAKICMLVHQVVLKCRKHNFLLLNGHLLIIEYTCSTWALLSTFLLAEKNKHENLPFMEKKCIKNVFGTFLSTCYSILSTWDAFELSFSCQICLFKESCLSKMILYFFPNEWALIYFILFFYFLHPIRLKEIFVQHNEHFLWLFMMIRGWKLITLALTIIVYVVGILVLSIVNLQSPSQKRSRNSRFFTDVSFF